MGIVLLLGVGLVLLALGDKKAEGGGFSGGALSSSDVEKFSWGLDPVTGQPKEFAKLTASGKARIFALFEQGYVVMPQMGVPGAGGTFLPLARTATGAVGMDANDYIASILDTTDVSVWLDANLNGIVIAEGTNQEVHGYPLVLMTTGAEGWGPAQA